MLEAFFESMDTGEFEDNGFIRMVRTSHAPARIELTLETGLVGEPEQTREWTIACKEVHDYRLLAADLDPAELIADRTHPAIRQHLDPSGSLVFSGSVGGPAADQVLGQLWLAHRNVTGGWIPFDRFLNEVSATRELLVGGYGLLASGPVFILEAYASVLRAHDYVVSPLLPRPPTYWDGSTWQPMTALLSMLRLGSSFVVAEQFELASEAA